MASNGGITSEWFIGKAVERTELGLFQGAIPTFARGSEENYEQLQ
jgi:hypothetical protein